MDFVDVLKKLAPTAATLLMGPLAGLAVQAIGDALGMEDATQDKITKALTSGNLTGDQVVALRTADDALKVKMTELGIRAEEMVIDDRKSARELAKVNMLPQIALSVIYSIGYFTLLYQFATGELVVPLQNRELLLPLLGVMTAAQVQIMNFWFGSSSGSTTKNHLLAVAEGNR